MIFLYLNYIEKFNKTTKNKINKKCTDMVLVSPRMFTKEILRGISKEIIEKMFHP